MFAMEDRHDIRLPDWGPYTKRYAGISHLPDLESGLRFDLSVIPGFYRRKVDVPNVLWESGYHPWEAAPDLFYYSHRHELTWKDQVYVEVSFSALDGSSRVVRCCCVNRTDEPQCLVLHYVASLEYPTLRGRGSGTLGRVIPQLPDGAVWIDALDYDSLVLGAGHPTDSLTPDGLLRGEVRGHGYVGGSALGGRFGARAGDSVSYLTTLPHDLPDATLLLRYRLDVDRHAALRIEGLGQYDARANLVGTGEIEIARVDLGRVAAGRYRLEVISLGAQSLALDGMALAPTDCAEEVSFAQTAPAPRPEISTGPTDQSLLLKYRDVETVYGLAWDYDRYQVRQFLTPELDCFMRETVHQHTRSVLGSSEEGHYVDVFLRPIPLKPGSQTILYGLVCEGERDELEKRLRTFSGEMCESTYRRRRTSRYSAKGNPRGREYAFSQERMAATVLTNVVYPVYCRRSFIRHNTPGRWWDSLYTWDAGFIGLGLSEIDVRRSLDCLNAYVTAPGDAHAAFLHHGSPVPVQFYLFQELWNRTRSKELLAFFYPRLRQYHRFLAGRLGSSTTRALRSNLLKTWDYFYNSGGWDDYPPQVYVHSHGLEDRVAPVINTAHTIRTAKTLAVAAELLGAHGDEDEYRQDVADLSAALAEHAWDEESGYFGYVVHDVRGEPVGLLRHESGANYDMGLDGLYPLVAGIGTGEQRARMIAHLGDEKRIYSPIGLSAVDQSAPYYRSDGYWNGTVWMAHQWFFWKALLDHGEHELACRVAHTALDLWSREVGRSYNCFEHFVIETGRGAGWHHFGGLSSPVLNWYAAYYQPGRLTVGLDTWVIDQAIDEEATGMTARLLRFRDAVGQSASALAVLRPARAYRATWEGEQVPVEEMVSGAVAVRLPRAARSGTLRVEGVGGGQEV